MRDYNIACEALGVTMSGFLDIWKVLIKLCNAENSTHGAKEINLVVFNPGIYTQAGTLQGTTLQATWNLYYPNGWYGGQLANPYSTYTFPANTLEAEHRELAMYKQMANKMDLSPGHAEYIARTLRKIYWAENSTFGMRVDYWDVLMTSTMQNDINVLRVVKR